MNHLAKNNELAEGFVRAWDNSHSRSRRHLPGNFRPSMSRGQQASFPIGGRWYAVYTNIKCEERVQLGLDAKGFRTFCPKLKKWVSHARVKHVVEVPLISRYLFVEVDPNKRDFEDIRQTDGVEALLANPATIDGPDEDRLPSVIPEGLIEELIRRQLMGEFDTTKGQLPEGARIRIMDGPYEDRIATIILKGGKNGGEILAQLLGERTRARFARISVRPA